MNNSVGYSFRKSFGAWVGICVLTFVLLGSACTQSPRSTEQRGLSQEERNEIRTSLVSEVSLAVLRGDGSVETHQVATDEWESFQERVLNTDSAAVVAANHTVEWGTPPSEAGAAQPDENLLFRGKLELGLQEWEREFPLADGRGVTVGVVDDGVALHRPGLKTTKGSELPKFAGSLTLSPLWQLPIRSVAQMAECGDASRLARTANLSQAWTLPAEWGALITQRIAFDLNACGINPELPPAQSENCARWKKSLPQLTDAQPDLPALYLELGSAGTRVVVDLNLDGQIGSDEVFRPLSEAGNSYRAFPATGAALAFDVNAGDSYPDPEGDHPSSDCWKGKAPAKILSVHLPHEGAQFGSHGEGVAAIAVGHQIGNRPIDGMAPGARLYDVHFVDPVGGRRYTIAEITRALLAAAKRSDIVNLSYSLYFSNPASQLAMSRMMSAVLNQTQAVFHFSAGNNGPGRGSMNRALLYPKDAIIVGAYLDPLLAQTTFGSSVPYGGVVSYSSRGPSPDGGLGALILGPLAGMVPSTADAGYRPFSGTSSATPAIAGLTARLISQLKQEGLPVKREWIRRALMLSARPLSGVAAVDQGWGLPWLPSALKIYRELAQEQSAPELSFSAGTSPTGVPRRGIFVVAGRERRDLFSTRIVPVFAGNQTVPQFKADYAETLKIESTAPWVRVTPAALVSVSGAPVEVALDWDWLEKNPGEHLAEVVVSSLTESATLTDSVRRAILPVTVIVPENDQWSGAKLVDSLPGKVHRLFIKKPIGNRATHLLLSRESLRSGQPLCGRFGVYDPSGASGPGLKQFQSASGMRAEMVIPAPESGVYEIVWVGGNSHTACPRPQSMELKWQWHHLDASVQQVQEDEKGALLELVGSSEAPLVRGQLQLTPVSEVISVELKPTADVSAWSYQTQAPLLLGSGVNWEVRMLPESLGLGNGRSRLPRWSLELTRAGSSQAWPAETTIDPQTGEFTTLSVSGLMTRNAESSSPAETVRLNWKTVGFEFGSKMGAAPPVVRLELRRWDSAGSSTKIQSEALEFLNENLTRFELTIPQNHWKRSQQWRCEFQPSGYELSVECPMLRL